MKGLLKNEIKMFFSNITGYLVIAIYLISNSLILWIIPGNNNVFDNGIVSINPLFQISPWLFLFLIPAITMRSFAEEKRLGTLELLLTKPLSETQIILSKFFASLIVVILAIIPSLVFYFSVMNMSSEGEIDNGAVIGSYLGLIMLSAVYASIGIWASANTDSQIIAFLLAGIVSFVFYTGFELISQLLPISYSWISKFGIQMHYNSISRGVLDTSDFIYFIGLVLVFINLTRWILFKNKG